MGNHLVYGISHDASGYPEGILQSEAICILKPDGFHWRKKISVIQNNNSLDDSLLLINGYL